MTGDLLHRDHVAEFLRERGIVTGTEQVRVRELGGGVSNTVFAAHTGSGGYVVKQSLPRLRVAEEWRAPRTRTLTEAAAMHLAGALTPHAVPPLIDCDPSRYALVMALAPETWTDWKSRLLTGQADPWAAQQLGATLARWHTATLGGRDLPESFADPAAFAALRVDPYHRTVMSRRPELAPAVGDLVEEMLARRLCLVHGDFSPKNILLDHKALWVTDFEVAHLGDPVFDLAFLLHHLLLKSVHRPQSASRYRICAEQFLTSYQEAADPALTGTAGYLSRHVGCLLAARVDGKSGVEYLTDTGRGLVRDLATALLTAPVDSTDEMWQRLPEGAP